MRELIVRQVLIGRPGSPRRRTQPAKGKQQAANIFPPTFLHPAGFFFFLNPVLV